MIEKKPGRSADVLVLTTDLPFFPGKNGHDHFNLRYLARQHNVSVVGPCYDSFPKQGVANLEAFLEHSYFWPRPAKAVHGMLPEEPRPLVSRWIRRLPSKVKWWILQRLLNIAHQPKDAIDKLAILSNCAPQLLQALTDRNWDSIVLIQTNAEPWLGYLPPMGGKVVYFHDVRADYLGRLTRSGDHRAVEKREVAAIHAQEQRVMERADVVGFVSELDHQRAQQMFKMRAASDVAAIAVDTNYYTPPAADWEHDGRRIVLFTGHLAHPPNVDAVLYFLHDIWPLVLRRFPDAVFQAVGLMPDPTLVAAMAGAPQCELHANVSDIRPYFWNANAYVVPMRYGGGVRQKIFEAWSMRVPVVCTTMAAEGTGANHGDQCFLEDSPESFAERIIALAGTHAAAPVVSAAKEFVEANYSITAAAPGFQRLVEKSISIKRNKPYKLMYDLRWMELGHAGGIEQATYELISAIGQLDRQNAYRIMAPRSACCEWDLPQSFQVKMHYSDNFERETEVRRSLLANGLAESLRAPSVLNTAMRNLANYHKLDFDLVHSVAGYTHPDLIGFPNVLTINDLQHIHYPEFFTADQYAERERLYRESAERANHIICISEYTRQDVHRQYGVPLEKMSTVWIIPSRNVWLPIPDAERRLILSRMGLDSPFLFFPAHCWPHKNHARLVDAFSQVIGSLPPDVKLVLTGRMFPEDHPAALLIRERGLGGRVVHMGYRSPLEIRALFQGCMSLVFPSLFEGYGMPVAEAIIAGKPVLCSDATSLPEIAGDAALTFDPSSVDAIGQALVEITNNEHLRAELSQAAINRRNLFAARRSAIETMAVYSRVYRELYGVRA